MYQDSSCSSSSRRGSAATATTTAAAAAATTTTTTTTTTTSDEETFEALTIITTTTITTTADAKFGAAEATATTTTTTTVITAATAAAATPTTTNATATRTTSATIESAANSRSNSNNCSNSNNSSNGSNNNSDDDDDVYTDADAYIDVDVDVDIDIECTTAHGSRLPSSNSSGSCGHAALQQQQQSQQQQQPPQQQQQQQQQLSQQQQQQQHQLQRAAASLNADVRLLRKIGYIASRVRCLAKYYGDFRLVNPYSAQRQRRQLQEILLKHSIFDPGRERERALLLAAASVAVGAASAAAAITAAATATAAATNAAAAAAAATTRSQSCSSCFEEQEQQIYEEEAELQLAAEQEDDEEEQELAIATVTAATATATATTTTTTATATVRRKSSSSSTSAIATATASASTSAPASASATASASASASASLLNAATPIALLEELLIQFYEDQDQCSHKLTVIRRRLACTDNLNNNNNNSNNNNISDSSNSSSSSNNISINNHHNNNSSNSNSSISNGQSLTMSTSMSNMVEAAAAATTAAAAAAAATAAAAAAAATVAGETPSSSATSQHQTRSYLQPSMDADNPRRRRASDCSAVQAAAALSNQLHCITLKNNNCTAATAAAAAAAAATGKLPFHRGSCGAAGDHLLAANSIANRATIILSKSCSNVDGDASLTPHIGNNKLRASATDIESNSNALNGAQDAMTTIANAAAAAASNNGNNEFSILQLNNTIIQCHFNDDDFRALVKDLKRKVEYTERMNWLCLSNRPLGPPHRKSSLPKHQEVKRRFLEICDTNFSDEVKAALRLPAFDSYEWGDADVIHLMQTMFLELGFIEKFSIPVDTLREWLYEVYKHYNEVPFHNFRHCFCVAQMMYAITRQANLLNRLGDLECLILLVSCICHDLDHPGYNNIYQINARTELALRYNDISPLENHHCSIAFRLLEHPECNIFKNFSRDTFNTIREGIIRCILATDMARHNEILTQFMEITPIFDYNNRAHINLLCMILIKVADISNEARPMDVAEPWLDRLLQEFFAQSAAEKSEGLPVTPFMDPDKVSKPGSQVRFIGLVLLPLFEALGELVPELTDLIIIPVRIALEYYRRLNDAQTKTRKSVADSNTSATSATSDSNSGNMDSNAAMVSTPGNSSDKLLTDKQGQVSQIGGGTGSAGGGGTSTGVGGNTSGNMASAGGTTAGGSSSPQMPRSGSGISVKSRRSIPSQKSASRTSMDEPGGMAAELHDLPEGSESGDSETATEVDVAEKTSKFKVDTEGCSNRSKSSHSTSRKSSREKRPSMIGELCSSGGGQRMRNSYGNIHGYHANRCHFGSNRAVSLDQYSTNNRRLSDGLPQVISDSNVFYGRHNRSSLESAGQASAQAGANSGRAHEDLNMNTSSLAQAPPVVQQPHSQRGMLHGQQLQLQLQQAANDIDVGVGVGVDVEKLPAAAAATVAPALATSNGNISPTLPHAVASNGSARSSSGGTSSSRVAATMQQQQQQQQQQPSGSSSSSSWKSRLRQFSDYFSFSFDKGNKRFGSTRSSPCATRGNNNTTANGAGGGGAGGVGGDTNVDSNKGQQTQGTCCTISNSMTSPGGVPQVGVSSIGGVARHRAYSLDVPCSRHAATRYSSGDSSSRKSSRHDEHNNSNMSNNSNISNNSNSNMSNNTLHSSSGMVGELPGIRIRIGNVEDGSSHAASGAGGASGASGAGAGASAGAGAVGATALMPPSLSCELGMASVSSSEAVPKI